MKTIIKRSGQGCPLRADYRGRKPELHRSERCLSHPVQQLKCFLDRLSSYFRRSPYAERFDGKGYIVVCAFGRPEMEQAEWVTRPLRATVEVLRGVYLGDVCASVYQKGRVREMPAVLAAAYALGQQAAAQMAQCRAW